MQTVSELLKNSYSNLELVDIQRAQEAYLNMPQLNADIPTIAQASVLGRITGVLSDSASILVDFFDDIDEMVDALPSMDRWDTSNQFLYDFNPELNPWLKELFTLLLDKDSELPYLGVNRPFLTENKCITNVYGQPIFAQVRQGEVNSYGTQPITIAITSPNSRFEHQGEYPEIHNGIITGFGFALLKNHDTGKWGVNLAHNAFTFRFPSNGETEDIYKPIVTQGFCFKTEEGDQPWNERLYVSGAVINQFLLDSLGVNSMLREMMGSIPVAGSLATKSLQAVINRYNLTSDTVDYLLDSLQSSDTISLQSMVALVSSALSRANVSESASEDGSYNFLSSRMYVDDIIVFICANAAQIMSTVINVLYQVVVAAFKVVGAILGVLALLASKLYDAATASKTDDSTIEEGTNVVPLLWRPIGPTLSLELEDKPYATTTNIPALLDTIEIYGSAGQGVNGCYPSLAKGYGITVDRGLPPTWCYVLPGNTRKDSEYVPYSSVSWQTLLSFARPIFPDKRTGIMPDSREITESGSGSSTKYHVEVRLEQDQSTRQTACKMERCNDDASEWMAMSQSQRYYCLISNLVAVLNNAIISSTSQVSVGSYMVRKTTSTIKPGNTGFWVGPSCPISVDDLNPDISLDRDGHFLSYCLDHYDNHTAYRLLIESLYSRLCAGDYGLTFDEADQHPDMFSYDFLNALINLFFSPSGRFYGALEITSPCYLKSDGAYKTFEVGPIDGSAVSSPVLTPPSVSKRLLKVAAVTAASIAVTAVAVSWVVKRKMKQRATKRLALRQQQYATAQANFNADPSNANVKTLTKMNKKLTRATKKAQAQGITRFGLTSISSGSQATASKKSSGGLIDALPVEEVKSLIYDEAANALQLDSAVDNIQETVKSDNSLVLQAIRGY